MNTGQQAPQIILRATDGQEFSSHQTVANGPLVVAFFPLAFTPG